MFAKNIIHSMNSRLSNRFPILCLNSEVEESLDNNISGFAIQENELSSIIIY